MKKSNLALFIGSVCFLIVSIAIMVNIASFVDDARTDAINRCNAHWQDQLEIAKENNFRLALLVQMNPLGNYSIE